MTKETKYTALDVFWNEFSELIRPYNIGLETGKELYTLYFKAKQIEQSQAQLYATFCFKCANKNIPIIKFEDWIDLTYGGNKIQCQCQFEMDTSTSSATKCKFCGKEKWQHITGRI